MKYDAKKTMKLYLSAIGVCLERHDRIFVKDTLSLKSSVNLTQGNVLGLRYLKIVALKVRFNLDE